MDAHKDAVTLLADKVREWNTPAARCTNKEHCGCIHEVAAVEAQRDELAALLREAVEGRNANMRAVKFAAAKHSPSWVRDVRAALAKLDGGK